MQKRSIIALLVTGLGFLETVFGVADGVKEIIRGHFELGPFFAVAGLITIAVVVILRWGGLHLLKTGIMDSSFKFTEDETAWAKAKKSITYVGFSGYSVIAKFLGWYEANRDKASHFLVTFYLLHPDDRESLHAITSHRKGREAKPEEVDQLASEVRAGVGKLREYPFIRIRSYRMNESFIPVWMYLIDEKMLYLGFPPPDSTGMNSPAYLCTHRDDRYGLFDAYFDLLERFHARNGG
jgi:hypothetical protein